MNRLTSNRSSGQTGSCRLWFPVSMLLSAAILTGCAGVHEGGVYVDKREAAGTYVQPASAEKPRAGKAENKSSKVAKASPGAEKTEGDAAFDRGITAYRAGNYAQALASFNTAVAHYPQRFSPRFNLVMALRASGREEAALTQARALEKDFPHRAELKNLIGLMEWQREHYQAAREAFEGAPVTENLPETHYNLGMLCEAYFADDACARQHYRQYLGLQQDDDKQVSAWLERLPPR